MKYSWSYFISWARSSVVGWGTMLQTRRSLVQFPMRSLVFSIHLILPATLLPLSPLSLWLEWVPGIFLGVKGSWHIRLTASLLSVSWLSRKCGSLDVSQPCGPPRLVTGIALLFSCATHYALFFGHFIVLMIIRWTLISWKCLKYNWIHIQFYGNWNFIPLISTCIINVIYCHLLYYFSVMKH
jgi:hypothetical protein